MVAALALAVVWGLAPGSAGPEPSSNWPQFRGPDGAGLSSETGLPVRWSASHNVRWRTPLPGPGHSSPIVWGNRIFVTAFRSEGGLMSYFRPRGTLLVVCLDKNSGRVLWEREVQAAAIEGVHGTNSPASPTPVTDGERVYVYFGSRGLVAFDLDGRQIWEKALGPFPNAWGSASSPIVHRDLLLLNVDTDGEDFLLALDRRSGTTVWRTARSGSRSWPTPVIWPLDGRDEIVVSGSGRVKAYDPKDGREIWTVDGLTQWVAPTPVAAHGLLFVASNGPGGNVVMALRPGGRGNVTSTHVAWRHLRGAPYNASPLVVGDYLYVVKNGGLMTCLTARTGEPVWQERLPFRGDYYSSPVAGDGKIYVVSEEGGATVLAAGRAFEVIAQNDMGERTMATPAISDGQLFIRTDEALYAIGR